ncbi:MAG: hypothetical protein JOS17DRAFT_828361 [Linnemannia elongata]|nr:MAG: hypothetical protein JOS17DRAFT_828361 [Linnemannia elongata]
MFTARKFSFLVAMVATVGLLSLISITNIYGLTLAQAVPAPITAFGSHAMVRRAVTILEKRTSCQINVECLLHSCSNEGLAVTTGSPHFPSTITTTTTTALLLLLLLLSY